MLQNYLKIAFRNFFKHRSFTLINGLGLALGIAACLLMFLYVLHEANFDGFHEKAARVVRITSKLKGPESNMEIASTPIVLSQVLKKDFPEIEVTARLRPLDAVFKFENHPVKEKDIYGSETSVFSVFSLPLIEGDAETALTKPNSIVLSEELARRYFKSSALGKVVYCNQQAYEVTGIMKTQPTNSDLKINALLSADFSKSTEWLDDFPTYTFAAFKSEPSLGRFNKKLNAVTRAYTEPEFKQAQASGWSLAFEAEMLRDVHFSQNKLGDTPKGDRQYIYFFSALAVFVLLIALLNYVNLSTAKATERAKEVGLRKVVGARKRQLVFQFLMDALLLNFVACTVAVGLVLVAEPFFDQILNVKLNFRFATHLPLVAATMFGSAFLAGFYPALMMSGFNPIKTLKGKFTGIGHGLALRKGITVFQFGVASLMLIGTVVIYSQLKFLQSQHPGFEKEQLVTIFLPETGDSLARRNIDAFVASLKGRSEVGKVSLGNGMHPEAVLPAASTLISGKEKKRELMSNYLFTDEEFAPLLKMKIKEGRYFSKAFKTDEMEGFVVNEAFVKLAGWRKPLGENIEGFGHKGKVIGVVQNFNYRSLHNVIEPVVMIYNTFPVTAITAKVRPENLEIVGQIWKEHFTNHPFNYAFLDDAFNKLYESDRLRMQIFNYFTLLAVFISMLGLYGLISVVTLQKTKEIGVRKVLGATVGSIAFLLSKNFIQLAVIGLLISFPLAWYLMDKWLQNFAYHIEVKAWMFALAGATATLVALLTVSWQAFKAALVNPVESLGGE